MELAGKDVDNVPERAGADISPNRKPITVVLIILVFLLCGMAGYFVGRSVNRPSSQEMNRGQNNTPLPSAVVQPSQPMTIVNTLGQTTYSYLENQNDIYIKTTIVLNNPIAEYPNSKLRTITRTFTQQADQTYEPTEVKEANVPSGSWIELIKEPIDNPTNAGSILVSDGLFSFKKVPNTSNFIFSIELMRSAGQAGGGSWALTKIERVLYLYNKNSSSEKLKKVQVFDKDNFRYSFPKIDEFSSDERYVSIKLFVCWGCGGHAPETYLLDTQTLKTKNLGRVSYFEWQTNGSYGYKDYIVIECLEPSPGECSQDPNTLPLKTGSI